MKARYFAPLLALLLLAGCQSPAVESPSPGPDPSPAATSQVTVHWDALEPREPLTTLADRLDDGPLTELIPSDSYGTIVPYIGGEQEVIEPWTSEDGDAFTYTDYLYGLCTADGLILTDPVYLSVYPVSRYDYTANVSHALPVWCVTQTAQDEAGEPYTAVGLAAADGSWFTGLRYRSSIVSTIAASEYSVLMMESDDAAVLISLADGRELARYTPYDFLSEADSDHANGFFDSYLSWGLLRSVDRYFCYDPQWVGMVGAAVWIDSVTGEILDEAPMEFPEEHPYTGTEYFFDGGWYEVDSDSLLVHYNDGTIETIDLPDGLGELDTLSRTHLLFYKSISTEDSYRAVYTLTDHSGKVLYATEPSGQIWMSFLTDSQTGRQYPYVHQYTGDYDWNYQLLDSEGEPLLTALDWHAPCGGLLPLVDDSCYRLVDLNSGEDLIRIPRWPALDLPADD